MADDTKDQIEQRLEELPENIRNAVLSTDTGQRIRVIGQRHNLHIDQIGKLEDETMLVMLGFFEPDAFNIQLEQQLLIPAADAAAIAKEVSDEIFMPIRESLKKFMAEKQAGTAETQPQTPTPAPMPVSTQLPVQTSSTLPVVEPVSSPITPIKINIPTPATPVIPQAPIAPPPMPAAEKMLSEKTVEKPIYKADPYREPIE